MSLFGKIRSAISSGASAIADFGRKVADGVRSAVEAVDTAVTAVKQKAVDVISRYTSRRFDTRIDKYGDNGTHISGRESEAGTLSQDGMSESEMIATISQRKAVVTKWQKSVEKDAGFRESTLKEMYLNMYGSGVLDAFEGMADVDKIKTFIDRQSQRFDNVMRDEVNSKVTPKGLREIDIHFMGTVEEYDAVVDEYSSRIYRLAKKNLEDLFSLLVDETNLYIKTETDNYLNDEQSALQKLQDDLTELSSDNQAREQRLDDLVDEIVSMSFIQNEAKRKYA